MIDPELFATIVDAMKYRKYGKYRGVVTKNEDELKRGRLEVRVPAVFGPSVVVWAEACVPYAGKGVGFFAMPPVDAGVWVEFEGGDTSFPIWSGCYWADGEAPQGGAPDIKCFKTDSITLTLDDTNDEAILENSSNASITMNAEVITAAKTGKHTVAAGAVTSDSGAKGKVDIQTSGVIVNSGSLGIS